MTAPSDELRALSDAYGVATEYTDWRGERVQVTAEVIRAVLAALDVDAATDDDARAALERYWEQAWLRVVPPAIVTRSGRPATARVNLPEGIDLQWWIELEGGQRRHLPTPHPGSDQVTIDGVTVRRADLAIPIDLPLGWHTLVAAASETDQIHATLAVTPDVLSAREDASGHKTWGVTAQLYQLRSHGSWGLGDLHDLAELARWAGDDLGADFVLVNPVHAAEPTGAMEPSPYLPTSRRFANPMYLRVEDVPEVAASPTLSAEAARLAATFTTADDRLDRDATWAAKRSVLRQAFDASGAAQSIALDDFRSRQGADLERYATWCALADERGLPWTDWQPGLTDPASAQVASFADDHARDIAFHAWLQLKLDEQLAWAQDAARAAGMSVGVIHDLAVGVHPLGSDAWGLADVLASGVTVGAPPDAFNQVGQNWNQPPWRPDRLAEVGYAPFRDMVRATLADAGGIRVDHIIGLFRLWWISDSGAPSDGTYVRYDHEALVGILALEAWRAGALVIGEDLGVVEPFAREYLAERGLLGTSILWFERGWSNEPLAPQHYRELCMSSVTTHDLPPTAGYLRLEHVRVRDELGVLSRDVETERAHEQAWVDDVRRALGDRGLLGVDPTIDDVVVALHAWIAETPSRMVGVSLADLAGDVRSINQPGTYREYPNWVLPLADAEGRPVTLEDLRASELARRVAGAVADRRPRPSA